MSNVHSKLLALALGGVVAVAGACGAANPTTSPSVAVADVSPTPPAATPSPKPTPSSTPSATPTASPTPAPTASPTPAPTPQPWASYKSKRYHYRIKYPPTWVVTPGTVKLADQFDDYGYPYVFISRDVVSGIASINLTATHDIAWFKSHYRTKLVSNKSVKLSGYAGRLLIFRGTDDGRKVLIQHLILAKGRVGYVLDMYSDLGPTVADRALFKKIYKTWRPT